MSIKNCEEKCVMKAVVKPALWYGNILFDKDN